jgi:hypothetical protein
MKFIYRLLRGRAVRDFYKVGFWDSQSGVDYAYLIKDGRV